MDQHTMKVSDLYDIAIFDISRDGEQWKKFLEFAARGNLYRYDFLNTCIIYEQYPEAEILLDFADWKKRGAMSGEVRLESQHSQSRCWEKLNMSTTSKVPVGEPCPGFGRSMMRMHLHSLISYFQRNIRQRIVLELQ